MVLSAQCHPTLPSWDARQLEAWTTAQALNATFATAPPWTAAGPHQPLETPTPPAQDEEDLPSNRPLSPLRRAVMVGEEPTGELCDRVRRAGPEATPPSLWKRVMGPPKGESRLIRTWSHGRPSAAWHDGRKRWALVIGMDWYSEALGPQSNSVQDAKDMAQAELFLP